MIVFDTEGTDLVKPEVVPLDQQPHLVQFVGIRLHPITLVEQDVFQFTCHPGIPLPETFQKITGIREEDITGKPPFGAFYARLVDFFLGQSQMAAHNLGYDTSVLKFSLMRMDRLLKFPWPPVHICTVEASRSIKGHNLSLSDLYNLARGKDKEERLVLRAGQFVKHKSLGKVTIIAVGDRTITIEKSDGKRADVKPGMLKGAAFEGAHGAMKDAQELVTCVRWLRKEGLL